MSSEDKKQTVGEECLAGMTGEVGGWGPCLGMHHLLHVFLKNLLDATSKGFICHRKSSEPRNVSRIPQQSLKTLMSPEQKNNETKKKNANKASQKSSAELYEGLSLTIFFGVTNCFARYF